ncbi:MAG: DNA cytosine methyltransferase [Planctomycetota bacterium]|nr:MAG: DNA cytosine methyltransferase [Planctomycetota bacterium]
MKKLVKGRVAVELFCGAGGLGLGLHQAGFSTLLANDSDENCCASYKLNFPHTKVICGDIHDIDFCEVAKGLGVDAIDLLAGGPPCQGFSTVGSKNEQDPRNSLFYEYLRVVSQLRPNYLLFENVSGFKRLYEGRAFATLVSELQELGYEYVYAVLNASDFGLPQHRLRTIVIAWKSGLSPVAMPAPTHGSEAGLFGMLPKLCVIDAISDLPPLSAGDSCQEYMTPPQNTYQIEMRGCETILTEHSSANYGEKMLEILSLIPPGGSVDDLPERLRPKNYFKNTYARLRPNEPSPTITRNFGTPSSSRCIHPFQNRALSTREGARLQSFPDYYKFVGGKGSKNLQIGNAVPPILGRVVGESIMASLSSDICTPPNHLQGKNDLVVS